MKKILIASCLTVICACHVFAKLLPVSVEELVPGSDLIVIGTLTDIAERRENGATYGRGAIVVERVLAGAARTRSGRPLRPDDRLRLDYAETFACVYGSHKRAENKKLVWLLTLAEDGGVARASFLPRERLTEIERAIGKKFRTARGGKIVNIENPPGHERPAAEPAEPEAEIVFGSHRIAPEYYPVAALLVALCSISLYYLLYRSRFRIR